jgi:hypothetical protein
MFVYFYFVPKKQHSTPFTKNRREIFSFNKKGWGWGLFHLTRPLAWAKLEYSGKSLMGLLENLRILKLIFVINSIKDS